MKIAVMKVKSGGVLRHLAMKKNESIWIDSPQGGLNVFITGDEIWLTAFLNDGQKLKIDAPRGSAVKVEKY